MKPFCFMHTADLHLDSPFQGIQQIDPDIADELKEATFKAFARIVDLTIEREAAFLLISGDVYDSADRSLTAQIQFRNQLAKLATEGIPSYVIHGNHDPLDGWRARLDWPDLVHFFSGNGVERFTLDRDGETLASIYGISYPHRDVRANLARQYKREADDPFAIGVLHANVGGDADHEAYAPCSIEDLLDAGMDYWALGHIHKRNILRDAGPAIVYAGNPQGRHPGEAGDRGVYVVEVDESGHPEMEFVATDSIRWVLDEISIESMEEEQELIDTIEERCQESQGSEEERALVCRFRLIGRGPLHRSLQRRGTGEIVEVLRDLFRGAKPFTWIERIDNQTRSSIDLAARAQREDFPGDFLRIAQGYREDSGRLEALKTALEPLFDHRTGRKYLYSMDDSELLSLLNEAEARCMDMMMGDED